MASVTTWYASSTTLLFPSLSPNQKFYLNISQVHLLLLIPTIISYPNHWYSFLNQCPPESPFIQLSNIFLRCKCNTSLHSLKVFRCPEESEDKTQSPWHGQHTGLHDQARAHLSSLLSQNCTCAQCVVSHLRFLACIFFLPISFLFHQQTKSNVFNLISLTVTFSQTPWFPL